ncbi:MULTISPECIES: DNA-methyltransferase [unclassified Rhizobium]|uniref:DNA-methyltransferase n=1 Tax=unclassified Rhizobium TaxID=2613769 RepID=UPI0007F12049|nr:MULTISPECIES: DNA methyltransferase [unclassified Rhizobium]ANL11949.1 restriction/modification DNA methylase protein [Rhizobium sp. N1341]ANM42794.1 restriction/modification DNA methylase protein [Rhizobium sp. N741]
MALAPGLIRDSIVDFLSGIGGDASTDEIMTAVKSKVGEISPSSVRSYLNLNTPKTFERTGRGRYRLNYHGHMNLLEKGRPSAEAKAVEIDRAKLYHGDSFEWLSQQAPASVHAIVTDPPYGLVEYTEKETAKLRAGKGGVWRIPPSFDGHQRAPLPRFTTLTENDKRELHVFFKRLGLLISRVAVPGANVVIASNPLLAHIVGGAMAESGLELRGYLARQVMTMRGGDRPKNAHEEFEDVSVMPRSQWEPWVILRTPLDGRVQDNLRRWGTGGFRRPSKDRPFGDLIRSHPTPTSEKKIAPHPSLKPQAFMRQIVRAVLPMGEGIVLDPFMGGGSTLAAANAVGYQSAGIELDKQFFNMAKRSIPRLAALSVKEPE